MYLGTPEFTATNLGRSVYRYVTAIGQPIISVLGPIFLLLYASLALLLLDTCSCKSSDVTVAKTDAWAYKCH